MPKVLPARFERSGDDVGIYGALSSAVTGLRAQSHALENISGNIANSQTTGYKRMETSFVDLIPDAPLKSQVPGAVLAQSRATNNLQGDIQTSANETFIALNANGFFVVEPKVGQADGNSVFAGSNFYTRRGDFEIDKDGLLVNGAGYYLKGLPIDPTTGNISGSVPEVIKLSNAFLPANATKTINYQANLPQLPKTASYNEALPNSELLKPWTYGNPSPLPVFPAVDGIDIPNPALQLVPARAIGDGTYTGAELAYSIVNDGDRLTTTIGGETYNLWFDTDGVPNSVVSLTGASAGWDAAPAYTYLNIAEADIAALYAADNLFIGSTSIPLAGYPADGPGLTDAIRDALGASSVTYHSPSGGITITYGGPRTPDTGASGVGITFGSGSGGWYAQSATTTLRISPHDIAGLNRSGDFQIEGVEVQFSSPDFSPDSAGLVAAIQVAFPGASASYDAITEELTIIYPAGALSADTNASGIGTIIDATADIDTMLASMQTELRALTGDDTLFVKLKNGEITISAGLDDANPLAFTGLRAGAITGDVLGLSPGPYDAIPGSGMNADNTYADLMLDDSDKLVISMGGTTRTYSFDTDGRQVPGAGEVEIDATGSLADLLAAIQSDLRANGGPAAANAVVSYGSDGVHVAFPGNYYYDASISGTAADKLEIAGTYIAQTGGLPVVSAADADQFLTESISGGAITVYAENGAPANVQLRWAKIDSIAAEGQDLWNLYYLADSNAVGNAPMWVNVGENYIFGSNGSLAPPGVSETTISNLKINGISIGDVVLQHDTNGVSQFADVNGTVSVSQLNQNGYGAGEFLSVAITDNGRVVATYSNGERIEMAQVVTAQFNGENSLKRLDGGVYEATSASGEPIFDLSGGGIIGGALEASNTDISDEFTKLIITQQAYSAGTRIVSAADEMLQEALNMVR